MVTEKEIKNRIKLLTEESKTKIVNHSLGYHGSSKDTCNYCGLYSYDNQAEQIKCSEGTKRERSELKNKTKELKNLLILLKKLKINEKKLILKLIKF